MKIARTNQKLAQYKAEGVGVIRLVPTMGALHQGHESLVKQAIHDTGCTVVSIFVNPRQFDDAHDFQNYPLTLDEDLERLANIGCDIAYVPTMDQVYDHQEIDAFDLNGLDQVMEGAHRVGHFDGVAQVINRLFKIVQPTAAYFGEKDFQQLAIIRQLTQSWKMEIDVVGCPIIRESTGLAMSSRNSRLNDSEREKATGLHKGLCEIAASNWEKQPRVAEQNAKDLMKSFGLHPEYVSICHQDTLQLFEPNTDWFNARVFAAAKCGEVRLIDNLPLS